MKRTTPLRVSVRVNLAAGRALRLKRKAFQNSLFRNRLKELVECLFVVRMKERSSA